MLGECQNRTVCFDGRLKVPTNGLENLGIALGKIIANDLGDPKQGAIEEPTQNTFTFLGYEQGLPLRSSLRRWTEVKMI